MSSEPSAAALPPVRVAFDHSIFAEQRFGGVTRYYARLAAHLPQFGVTPKILAPLYVSELLRDVPPEMVWGRFITPSTTKKRLAKGLGLLFDIPLARAFKADIVHESFHSRIRTSPKKTKLVTTMHDMTHDLFPDLFLPRGRVIARKKASLERTDWIICDSENTRQDLLKFYPQLEGRTSVVHLGFDPAPPPQGEQPQPHDRPYFLYVGMRRDYKNFDGLVEAFARSTRLRHDFDVVCIGDGPFKPHERAALEDRGIAGNFLQFAADDAALQRWYRHAHLFVYPSTYEGFGIPPLEAMAAGSPVVAMNVSSVPEICGDAAEYATPGNHESLVGALENVAYSRERADELRTRGRERITHFSWAKCAQETSAVYRSLL
jgi:glycosyltransferase involved in cell wall biosynthesis